MAITTTARLITDLAEAHRLDADLAKAEPKTLRYGLLHAARLVRSGRGKTPKIAAA